MFYRQADIFQNCKCICHANNLRLVIKKEPVPFLEALTMGENSLLERMVACQRPKTNTSNRVDAFLCTFCCVLKGACKEEYPIHHIFYIPKFFFFSICCLFGLFCLFMYKIFFMKIALFVPFCCSRSRELLIRQSKRTEKKKPIVVVLFEFQTLETCPLKIDKNSFLNGTRGLESQV